MKQLFLVPNLLTISRVLLISPSIYFLNKSQFGTASILIIILLLTDFFDGFLARKLNQTSYLGSILDPVADKIVVIAFFTHLVLINSAAEWYYGLVLTRDLLQLSVIPILLLWKKIQFQVKPNKIAKLGTVLNFIVLAFYEIDLAVAKAPELFGQYISDVHTLNVYTLLPALLISACIEIYILFTFIPRFYQIYKGTHDTFE